MQEKFNTLNGESVKLRKSVIAGLLIIAAFMACMALYGCNSSNAIERGKDSPKEIVDKRFLCDNNQYSFETVTDVKTGVVYLLWRSCPSKSSIGGITVLVHEDGTPVISEEVAR